MRMRFAVVAFVSSLFLTAADADVTLSMDSEAAVEILPLAYEAISICERASQREARHVAELRKKGIAEVPACKGERYVIACGKDLPPLFVPFDDRGELYIDRRFVTDKELETIKAIERWIVKYFSVKKRFLRLPVSFDTGTGVPVFRGFEDARYQRHDGLIVKIVNEFNADKANWAGATVFQAAKIPDLTPAMVKSHMIEEAGGNGSRSKAAWEKDPLQVNVPGDWSGEKTLVGLKKPSKRNEGNAEENIRAAIKYLVRKGFSSSARPAANRPDGYFDGWRKALQRYNGRRDRTDTDRYYSDEYADRILRRAYNPDLFVPIEIRCDRSLDCIHRLRFWRRYSLIEIPKRRLKRTLGGIRLFQPHSAVILETGSSVCLRRRLTSSSRMRSIAS